MKTKKNLFHPSTAAALLSVVLVTSTALQAATFTWTGAVSDSWVPNTGNWDPNPAVFGNTADLVFNTIPNPNMFLGFGRTVRSISFGSDIDTNVSVSFQTTAGGATGANLTFDTDVVAGNATVTVANGSTGNITLGNGLGGTNLNPILADNLVVDHNGTGLLLFNRPFQAAAFGITKTGTGTMQTNNNNLLTGPLNINQGRFIANTFGDGLDIRNFSSVNLNGGTLQVNHNSDAGNTKTYTNPFNVIAASTIAFYNSTSATEALILGGVTALDLGADLTMQNISTDTALSNLINLSRNLTGAGDLIVDGYNTITSGTTNFGLGRVALGGNNSGWAGDLVVLEGAAEVYGDTAVGAFNAGTGDIILGETSNTAGAAFTLSASTPTSGGKTLANDIIVRASGFRTLRGNSDHTYNINGNIVLDGDLNVHNGLFFNDKNMILNGTISGTGDLNVTKGTLGGFTRLTGDNSGWSGDLIISQGAVNLFGTANTPGTGDIIIGATGDTTAASLTFSHAGSLTYTNDIIVNTGGTRSIQGNGGLGINVTFSGGITLNGNLTLDHTWSSTDRRFNLNGPISGNGDLTITRTAGNTGTTARLAGTNTYTGATLVAPTASLALASTCSLTSNITVQSGARIGGSGSTTGTLNLESGANFFFFYSLSYAPMSVVGAVTLDNSFGIASLVGGSQGEVVPWAGIPAGTYTLIGTTASTFGNIQNFGIANAVAVGGGKTAYFQNGGGTGGGGLQLVITAASDPYAIWSGGAAFDVDTNNDGIANGLAFLLGAQDVDVNANGLLPAPTQSGGALTLTFSMRNAAARGTASLQVQHSSDLGITDAWSTLVTVPDADDTVGGIVFDITDGTPLNGVIATIPASGNAAGGRLFGRVKSNP